ncbi:hypothetical protein DH2020_009764 [Rehmannia glutinosa]|uniref:Homeobox-leucine zipper protein n=1 Tax=Rehmannia glutinosa TaxID=99300 RepID=A0ABR0X8H2_REHGL
METPTNNSSPQTSEENTPKSTKKKSKNNIARRFSDEQIKSLESIFKLEAKLEPRKKIQLARDLGLQPRQVAIWFALKTLLLLQLQELNDLVKNLDHKVNLTDDEFKEYPNSSNEGMDHNEVMKTDDKNFTKDFEKTEEQELVSWDEEEEISHLTSPEKWCDFSSGGLFDHSSGTSNWWEG